MSIHFKLALMSTLLIALTAANRATDRVHVDGGVVEGTASAKPGVRVFKGIPYAAAPVGELRWKAPQPVVKWTGIRLADHFGPRCMQAPIYNDMIFRDTGSSEDCLHLNVWTPAKTAAERLPVMLWIHGGGFQAGASSEPRQEGEVLATKGVIVVSINYRMGVFGFLAHPELTKESSHHASGNYGLMDQWQALLWVQKNIKAFGGDPKKVTIFGESAGSFSVSGLMASPLSKDLIAGAIGESGAFFGPTLAPQTLSAAEQQGTKFGADLAALRAISADKLLATSKGLAFNPIVDGYFFPSAPAEIFASGKQAHVPLLAGWNADEMPFPILMSKDKMTPQRLEAQFREKFANEAEALEKAYPASNEDEALQAARELSSDQFIGYSTWKWIDVQSKTGGKPVYRYSFTRVRTPKPGAMFAGTIPATKLGAVHASEIEYVFGALDSNKDFVWQPEDYKVSEMLQNYWTNFAKTGDPNGPGVPKWGTYPAQVMRLDVDGRSSAETHRERYEALDRFYAK